MKLYYHPASTSSRAVILFATVAEIPLELVFVDMFAGETRSADYLVVNASGLVPTLVDGEFRLSEASAILKYLAEKAGSPAYPADLQDRARVNEAMDWFLSQLANDFGKGFVYPLAAPERFCPTATLPVTLAWHVERSERWLDVLEGRMLRGRPYVCGEQITIADYLGAALVSLGELVDHDLGRWPAVADWLRRIKADTQWDLVNAAFYGWRSALQEQRATQAMVA
jgi:glutathione S-transferase